MAAAHDGLFVCITDYELHESDDGTNDRHIYAVLSLCSSAFGWVGASWQLVFWGSILRPMISPTSNSGSDRSRLSLSSRAAVFLSTWRRALRKPYTRQVPRAAAGRGRQRSRRSAEIVFNLALANALACIGTAVKAVCLLATAGAKLSSSKTHNSTSANDTDCAVPITTNNDSGITCIVPSGDHRLYIASIVIESFTTYVYTAGWLWTLAYAVDVCHHTHVLCRSYGPPSKPWIFAYKLVCWGLPVATCLVCVLLTVMTYVWRCPEFVGITIQYLMQHLPLVVVMVITPVLFVKSRKDMGRIVVQQTGAMTNSRRVQLTSQSRTFAAIVVIFLVCWLPNLVDVVAQILSFKKRAQDQMAQLSVCLWFLEASLNPLQGLINCFLYGMTCRRTTQTQTCCSRCTCCVSSNHTQAETDGILNAGRRSVWTELKSLCRS